MERKMIKFQCPRLGGGIGFIGFSGIDFYPLKSVAGSCKAIKMLLLQLKDTAMDTLKKLRLSMWKRKVEQYYMYNSILTYDKRDFTFPPSQEFIDYLMRSFTESTVERYENGPTFSSYHVSYAKGKVHGEAIFKTTVTTYPQFSSFTSLEEYQRSFSKDER